MSAEPPAHPPVLFRRSLPRPAAMTAARIRRNADRQFTPQVVGPKGLTPHELRHTAASLAVAEGANVKAVQRMFGHASAAMTLDVYANLFEGDLDQVAERLDQAATRESADCLRTDLATPAFDAVQPKRKPRSRP